jgi:hypothetical protein
MHLDETFARFAAHAPGWGVCSRQIGVQRFQLLEPPNQDVIFGVGDFGGIQYVVKVFVTAQLLAELFYFPRGIFHSGRNGNEV